MITLKDIVSLVGSLITLGIAIFWLIVEGGFEPLITVIALASTFLGLLAIILKKQLSQRKERIYTNYYKEIKSQDYIDFENMVISTIYQNEDKVFLGGVKYPIVAYPANKDINYPFNELGSLVSLNKPKMIENPTPFQKEYYSIVGKNIRRPRLEGYALEKIELIDGVIRNFSARMTTYYNNIITSHILEYEIYCLYAKLKAKNQLAENFDPQYLLNNLPIRQSIINSSDEDSHIISGNGRDSLLSVQLLIVFPDKDGKKKTVCIIRSKDVASKPNFLQIIPAGGFELYENESVVQEYHRKSNFDVRKTIFRELLEEVFGYVEMESNEQGNTSDNIFNDEIVGEIIGKIERKEANFDFVGVGIDLVTLRPELSFVLEFKDAYLSKKFTGNHESLSLETPLLSDIKVLAKGHPLTQGSAALIYLYENYYNESILN